MPIPYRPRESPAFCVGDIVSAHLRPSTSSPDYLAEELADGVITALHSPRSPFTSARPTYDVLSMVYLNEYVDFRSGHYIPEEHMVLVRRGNLWKALHGEQPTFSSVRDEARFWLDLDQAVEVRKPLFADHWTSLTLEAALRKGRIDAFRGPVGARIAYKFDDKIVGTRVREFFLEQLSVGKDIPSDETDTA